MMDRTFEYCLTPFHEINRQISGNFTNKTLKL